jgi:hypothetical protein
VKVKVGHFGDSSVVKAPAQAAQPRGNIEQHEMDEHEQINISKRLQVGDTIFVEYATKSAPRRNAAANARVATSGKFVTRRGLVVAKHQQRPTVRLYDDKTNHVVGQILLPATDDGDIYIKSVRDRVRDESEVPIATEPKTKVEQAESVRYVIYTAQLCITTQVSDAGFKVGAAAAAIRIVDISGQKVEEHARFYACTSPQAVAWLTLAAAVTAAKRLVDKVRSKHEDIIIASDNAAVVTAFNDAKRPRDAKLGVIYDEAKAALVSRVRVVYLAHNRNFNPTNPAKALATATVESGEAVGCDDVFADAPLEIITPTAMAGLQQQQHAAAAVVAPEIGTTVSDLVDQIKTPRDFAQIRRFHVRSRCPLGFEAAWAILVRQQLTRIIAAPSRLERDDALIGFMVLPTLFMPTRASTTKLMQRVTAGRGFAVSLDMPSARAARGSADTRDAISRRVEQLANNFQVRNAVKLMQANAESTPANFEKNVCDLRAKFPRREAADKFETPTTRMVAPFSGDTVLSIVRKMSRSAATAIDGWSRDLLLQAMTTDGTVADMLGTVLAWIAASNGPDDKTHFGKRAMDIVRAARLVAIPKPEGGVRPIVISSMLAKLAGAATLRRCEVKQLQGQYGISINNGAQRIVHLAREALAAGKAVVRLDIRNAYNECKRAKVLAELQRMVSEDGAHSDLVAYFSTMYGPTSQLFVFGPGGKCEVVEADEGVRQGDAPSSYYFCVVMACVCAQLRRKYPDLNIKAFMDDTTIICDPANVDAVVADAVAAFHAHGFTANVSKSAVCCAVELPRSNDAARAIAVVPHTEPFDMLGACITSNYSAMDAKVTARVHKFFDALDALAVHPEIRHCILRLCGAPKLIYYAATTPPALSAAVINEFQRRMIESFAKLIGVDVDKINTDYIHAAGAGGLPNYVKFAADIYNASREMTKTGAKFPDQVRLTTTLPQLSSPDFETDGKWSRYNNPTFHEQLPPVIYTTALALRCNVIPRSIYNGDTLVCQCTRVCKTPAAIISHAQRCERVVNAATRHQKLKYALVNVARCYGIGATVEPTEYFYADTIVLHRPDVKFYLTDRCIVTDVTIVSPSEIPGEAAEAAAKKKVEHHATAVASAGHTFIAFAMESTGLFDTSCDKLISTLATGVPIHLRYRFVSDMYGAAATAVAYFRARAVRNALQLGSI